MVKECRPAVDAQSRYPFTELLSGKEVLGVIGEILGEELPELFQVMSLSGGMGREFLLVC